MPRNYGHTVGAKNVDTVCRAADELGVKYLTLYAFSTENWNRPETEIHALMGLVLTSLEDEIFMKNNVRFRVIGDVKRLPQEVQDKLHETEEHTKHNDTMTMVVALSYSSRWEITKAVKDIIEERTKPASRAEQQPASCAEQQPESTRVQHSESTRVQRSESADITEEVISQHLETSFMPDPDLLIRTGGELRISNFLLWQIAYSELYFCDTYWPDFSEEDLHKAIASYQSRQRRYGKTEAQVEENDRA